MAISTELLDLLVCPLAVMKAGGAFLPLSPAFPQVRLDQLLQDGGSWLLHTIGDSVCSSDPWLDKHIFPNGELP